MAEYSEGGQVATGGKRPGRMRDTLPPFIVVEKGEALDEFVQRAQPDMYQSVAVRAPHGWAIALNCLGQAR